MYLQEDKEAVFDAIDNAKICLELFTSMISTMTVRKERLRQAASGGFINATDCADYLVKKGMPFREAHHAVGKAVKLSETQGCDLKEIPLEKWKGISPLFDGDVYKVFSIENAVDARCAWGGTARFRVLEQIRFADRVLQNS